MKLLTALNPSSDCTPLLGKILESHIGSVWIERKRESTWKLGKAMESKGLEACVQRGLTAEDAAGFL